MDFRDFPRMLGKSGKYEIHPPKLCASLVRRAAFPRARPLAELRVRVWINTWTQTKLVPVSQGRLGFLFQFDSKFGAVWGFIQGCIGSIYSLPETLFWRVYGLPRVPFQIPETHS